MDELTIFLIIIGIIVIAIIAIVTLLKNKNSEHQFNDFSHHDSQDVLLNDSEDVVDGVIGKVKVVGQADDGLSHNEKLSSNNDIEDLPPTFSTSSGVDLSQKSFTQGAKQVAKSKPSTANKPSSKPLHFSKEKLPEGMKDLIISMSIQKENQQFYGHDILLACEKNGLLFGEMDIFHYPAPDDAGFILFSMANMVEPGTFNPVDMENKTTPGLSLFIQLPLPMNCVDAYKKFVTVSQQMAKSLNADLYDDKFNLLTQQIVSHNIETINIYKHELLKAQKQSSH